MIERNRIRLAIGFVCLLSIVSCQTRQFIPIAVNPTQVPVVEERENELFIPLIQRDLPTLAVTPTSTSPPYPANQETIENLQLPYLTKPVNQNEYTFLILPEKEEVRSADGKFSIILQTPTIIGQRAKLLNRFNQAVQTFKDEEYDYYLSKVEESSPGTPGGSLVTNYSIASSTRLDSENIYQNYQAPSPVTGEQAIYDPGHPIISVLFFVSEFFDGANPHEHHYTINFDLEKGKILTIDELFEDNSRYLRLLSRYSIAELKKQPGLVGQEIEIGAGPRAENYNNWLITPDGLLILFEEYQVEQFTGMQKQVLIPYEYLSSIIDVSGPIGDYGQ